MESLKGQPIWMYWVITAPLTLSVLGIWVWWTHWRIESVKRRERRLERNDLAQRLLDLSSHEVVSLCGIIELIRHPEDGVTGLPPHLIIQHSFSCFKALHRSIARRVNSMAVSHHLRGISSASSIDLCVILKCNRSFAWRVLLVSLLVIVIIMPQEASAGLISRPSPRFLAIRTSSLDPG